MFANIYGTKDVIMIFVKGYKQCVWLVFSNTILLHFNNFKRVDFNIHLCFRVFYASRGRITRFILYQLEKHLKTPLIISLAFENSGGE